MNEDNPRAGWSALLPDAWAWATFGDVAIDLTDSKRKLAKKSYQPAGRFPVIDQGEEFANGFSDEDGLVSKASLPCVVWGDHTRRSKFVKTPFIQGADGVKVLVPSKAVLPDFFFKQITFAELPDKGYSRHYKFLKAKEFPLPPLAEQRRIVRKLDTLSARITTARTHLSAIAKLVDRMRGAVLSQALNGTLLPQQEAVGEPVELSQIISGIEQGWSPPCDNEPASEEDEWAVLTTTALQKVNFSSEENKRLPAGSDPRAQLEVQKNDVLITRKGPRVRCGICSFVAETRPRCMFPDTVYRLTLTEEVDPEFFVYLLNSPELLRDIDRIKSGGNESGLNLTHSRLKSLSINLWELDIQRDLVVEIKRQFAVIDRLAAEAEKALKLTDWLGQRILAKAFSGGLVLQDPNDEPASVLLDRIRAERASAPKPQRGRKKKADA